MISKSVEDILERTAKVIRVTDIASKMNCTKASVNKSLKILKEEKLVSYEPYRRN